MKPTGARLPLNIPMPAPLFKNTSLDYPGFNMNTPDQYRADVFLREFHERYESGREPVPRYMFMYLPNDHGDSPRPGDGYPVQASSMAVFRLLGLPSLSLYDALASDFSDVWTDRPVLTPCTLVPVDPRLFDPARAKAPLDPDYRRARLRPSVPLDDPEEVERLRHVKE
jgi:hypothetical protein